MDERQLASEDLLASMDVASAAVNGKQAAKPKRGTIRQTGVKPPVTSSMLSSRLQQQKARLQKAARAEQQHGNSSSKIGADSPNRNTTASDDQTDDPAEEISQPRSRSISPSAFATISVHKVDAALQQGNSSCKQVSTLTRTGSRGGMKAKQELLQTGHDQGQQQNADQLPVTKCRPSSRRTSRSQVMHNYEQGGTAVAGQRQQAEFHKEIDTSECTATQVGDMAAHKTDPAAHKERRDVACEVAVKQLRTASGLDADSAAAAAAAAAAIAAAAVVAAAMPNPDDVLGADEHAAAAIKAAEEAAAAAAVAAAEQAAMAAAAAEAKQAAPTAAAATATEDAAESWPALTHGQKLTDHASGRQRKRIGRPPKAAIGSMPAPAAVSNQHHHQQRGPLGRLSSMGDGRRISVDEPYRHSMGAECWTDLNTCSQADMVTVLSTWKDGAVAAATAAAAGTSGVRTRLSMRSVAYLEDLLQQTEAEKAVDANTSNSKVQHAARSGTRGTFQHAGASALEHRRLSVGNLIISPPMSRATSTSLHVLQAGGSSRPNSGEAAGVAQILVTKKQHFSKADAASSKDKAEQAAAPHTGASTSPAEPQDGQNAVAVATRSGSRRNSASAPAADGQPFRGRRRHAAGAGTPNVAAGTLKLPGAAELTRAAAAAVAAWQQVAAAGPKARGAKDMQSSSDEDSDDPEAAAWAATAATGDTAARTGACTAEAQNTYANTQDKHRHRRSRRGSYSSDTSSEPSSGSPVFDSCIMRALAAGSNVAATAAGSTAAAAGVAPAAGGLGTARGLLYSGLLQGFGGAPAATVMFQGCRPSAFMSSTMAGPAVPGAGSACAMDRSGWHHTEGPRKSDRQVGLETVQRIDSILQQSRSGVLATSAVGAAVCLASNGAAASQRASSTGIASHQQQHINTSTGGLPVGAPASGASTPPPAARTGAGAANSAVGAVAAAADVERCSVAALCRGLRFDGDITLKEVAMAFQLRDAYDWDEDLEAAAKEANKAADADPRMKGPRLRSRSPSLSNSSVCPDPEPAPGVLPRSTWMAGNRDGPSPIPSVLVQKGVRTGHHCGSNDYRGDVHAASGRGHSLLQRLHKQNVEGHGSLPGSITSSRRDSLAGSPVCGLGASGDMTSHPGELYQPPAPAVLHAALTAAQQQQQGAGLRGWQAMQPNSNGAASNTDTDRQTAQLQQPGGAGAQAGFGVAGAAYGQHSGAQQMQARAGPGRGHHRRKKRNADDSDDDYDPSKPSHQQDCYQRKQYVKRQQQQYHYLQQQHQRMMYGRLARLSYGGTILPQQYSAAIQQQMYMLQAAARAGGGLAMQQLQQLQFIQHQQIAAMAAAEQQAAIAAAAAAASGAAPAATAEAAAAPVSAAEAHPDGVPQQEIEMQHGDIKSSSPETEYDQISSHPDDAQPQAQQLPTEQQQLQHQQHLQPLQEVDEQPAQQQQQPRSLRQDTGQQQPHHHHHHQQQQQELMQRQHQQQQLKPTLQDPPQLQHELVKQAPQQQQQQDQQVRRPSYVKRRLTASDAADWLQSHGCQQTAQQLPIQISMQQDNGLPMSGIGPSRFNQMVRADSQELGLHIVSPTAHRDPAHSMLLQQQRHRQLAAAAIAAAAPSPAHSSGIKRVRKRTAAGMLLDAQSGVSYPMEQEDPLAGPGDISTEDDSEIESDVSDAEVGYSAGSRGRGRGRRGRGRGRSCAVRGGRGGRSGASLLSRASTPPLCTASPVPLLTGSQGSPDPSFASTAFGSRARGRGRGRGRGRSLLGSRAPSPGPASTGLGIHAEASGVATSVMDASAAEAKEYASGTSAAAAVGAADTAAALPGGMAGEAAAQAGDTPAPQGRGRGRGRGRRGHGSLLSANGWGGGFSGSIGSLSAVAASAGRAGRRGRGRGRGRANLLHSGAYGTLPAMPAYGVRYGDDSVHQLAAHYAAAAEGLPPHKRQRLANGFARTGSLAEPGEYGQPQQQQQQQQHALVGMPAWFVAGLADGAGASDARALASRTDSQTLEEQLMSHQGLLSPGSLRLPRPSLGLLGPVSNPKNSRQLHNTAGRLQVEQQLAGLQQQRQSVQGGGWVMQVTDGGVVVQMPAGALPGDGDDQLMQDLGPMSQLMHGLGTDDGHEDLL